MDVDAEYTALCVCGPFSAYEMEIVEMMRCEKDSAKTHSENRSLIICFVFHISVSQWLTLSHSVSLCLTRAVVQSLCLRRSVVLVLRQESVPKAVQSISSKENNRMEKAFSHALLVRESDVYDILA